MKCWGRAIGGTRRRRHFHRDELIECRRYITSRRLITPSCAHGMEANMMPMLRDECDAMEATP